MPDRTVSDVAERLLSWADQPPSVLRVQSDQVKSVAGERHGSWFVRLAWESGGMARAVDVAITNATALPDNVASEAYVSVRASASTEAAWVATPIYDRRRSLTRVTDEALLAWVATGASVASSYTQASLSVTYPLNSVGDAGNATVSDERGTDSDI